MKTQWWILGNGPGGPPARPPPPLIFKTKLRTKGLKKSFLSPPPLISGSGWPPASPPYLKVRAPVVQKVDDTIHRINFYPVDSTIGFPNTYPVDSNFSGGWRYPTFEHPGPRFATADYWLHACIRVFLSRKWGLPERRKHRRLGWLALSFILPPHPPTPPFPTHFLSQVILYNISLECASKHRV